MELKVSSPKQGALSPPDCVSDPEEKEISDEDDDDRNHKHRRREARSQSSERDGSDQVFMRPHRKHNKHFGNGHFFKESESQANETWKSYNISSLGKDFTTKFERRRPGLQSLSRAPLELNQRIRANQTFSGDPGPGRGRGRDSGSWNIRDSRFNCVDIASQMVQPGSLFGARGLPAVSSSQNASWSTFGILPGVPNGGLDTLHSIAIQGTLRPPINSSLNMAIPRQRCRDFEERGFCLRGDMCPMEHGVNRIVVEDVQSLSQFNLPVSLPSAQLLAAPAVPGPLPSVGTPSTLINSKGVHSKNIKPGMSNDDAGLNDAYHGSAGADFYDPDQPLWNNNCPETSTALSALHSPKLDGTGPLLVDDRHHGADNECPIRSTGPVSSQTLSVWGRIGSSKNKSNTKEKIDATLSSSEHLENEAREYQEALGSGQGIYRQGKRIIADDAGPKTVDLSSRTQGDAMRHMRKPSQKALRTLFVNGIPRKSNKREALLSHFQKFGEIIDIYIPLNSERAFVQFSRREEAEAALKAPDAVMGNRFIKLWWANRDSIPDDGTNSSNNVPVTSHGMTAASVSSTMSVASRGKDILHSVAPKGDGVHRTDVPPPLSDHLKPVVTNGPKVPPPFQKKLENLEQLKEELRKKQEMLDQKRNDFRRKLDKLEKQATGVKGEVVTEQAAKRLKVGVAADVAKVSATRSCDADSAMASQPAEILTDENKPVENVVSHSSKLSTTMVLQESNSVKQPIRPLGPLSAPFMMNRYKLDNRPTTFRIVPPLPTGLVDVAILKEHFSSYGDLSTVELEDVEADDLRNGSETSKSCAAHVTFTTRRAAERAFVNGKCWQGHNLQFVWGTSSNSSTLTGSRENSASAVKGPSDVDVHPVEKLACSVPLEASTSGNEETEKLERKNSTEPVELHVVSQPSPTTVSGEKDSPKANVC